MTTLLETKLVRADHIRSFHVHTSRATGWETAEHEDQRVVHEQRFTDWHRVERTLDRFARDIARLRGQGWHEA
jgi:hypothetical protein